MTRAEVRKTRALISDEATRTFILQCRSGGHDNNNDNDDGRVTHFGRMLPDARPKKTCAPKQHKQRAAVQ